MVTRINPDILASSSWISIPAIYLQSRQLLVSIFPILLLSTVPSVLAAIAVGDDGVMSNSLSAATTAISSPNHDLESLFSCFDTFENFADVVSLFVLVRMAKLIGADRDLIIAEKIDETCKKYPQNSKFVVVIGMLHCNGVARRLLVDK